MFQITYHSIQKQKVTIQDCITKIPSFQIKCTQIAQNKPIVPHIHMFYNRYLTCRPSQCRLSQNNGIDECACMHACM